MDELMAALMEGLVGSKIDYEIMDVSNGEAWVEVAGKKFTVRVEERDD